mgnify:CR=1 FL=1
MAEKPKILLTCNQRVREGYFPPEELERLEGFATWDWFECTGGGIYDAHKDPETIARLGEKWGMWRGWWSVMGHLRLTRRSWIGHQI